MVLDASALVDLATRAERSTWVLDHLMGHEISAPGHQPVEFLSAVTRLARADILPTSDLSQVVDRAFELSQTTVPITRAHVRRAVQLQASIRVTDGLYVALAEELACPLLTTDRRLARSVTTCEVISPTA